MTDHTPSGLPQPQTVETTAPPAVPSGIEYAAQNNMAVTREWLSGFNACRALSLPVAPKEEPRNESYRQWEEGYEVGRKGGIGAPELHPATAALVLRFSDALREKLAAAEKKYGYSDGWASGDWMDECRAKLMEHIAKGDPRDVAAYCAFLWHHGESTATPQPDSAQDTDQSAPWLTKAHLLCTDHGIPQGRIDDRLDGLRERLSPVADRSAEAQQAAPQAEAPRGCALCWNKARIPPVCDACHDDMGTIPTTPQQAEQGSAPALQAGQDEPTCEHDWTDEHRENGWRSQCRRCGLKAQGSGQ